MRAVLFRDPDTPVELVDVGLAGPRTGEVRVRITASVCRSELHLVRGEWETASRCTTTWASPRDHQAQTPHIPIAAGAVLRSQATHGETRYRVENKRLSHRGNGLPDESPPEIIAHQPHKRACGSQNRTENQGRPEKPVKRDARRDGENCVISGKTCDSQPIPLTETPKCRAASPVTGA
ncbi:hypothetical protein F9C11_17565 [Amycolatopsis sp. VS8301801F10]|uniref:hypothetical protein n=1 Tax=Amycolatopsis sp. VS8301801F10 TaxID=2652442 RepID=UPI0038FC3FCA